MFFLNVGTRRRQDQNLMIQTYYKVKVCLEQKNRLGNVTIIRMSCIVTGSSPEMNAWWKRYRFLIVTLYVFVEIAPHSDMSSIIIVEHMSLCGTTNQLLV